MSWEVKATAHSGAVSVFRTVVVVEDDEVIDDDGAQMIMYWVRNMDPGEKVVIKRV